MHNLYSKQNQYNNSNKQHNTQPFQLSTKSLHSTKCPSCDPGSYINNHGYYCKCNSCQQWTTYKKYCYSGNKNCPYNKNFNRIHSNNNNQSHYNQNSENNKQIQQNNSQQQKPQTTTSQVTSNTRCYKCQGFGHIAKDCPNKRTPICKICFSINHRVKDCPRNKRNRKIKQQQRTLNKQKFTTTSNSIKNNNMYYYNNIRISKAVYKRKNKQNNNLIKIITHDKNNNRIFQLFASKTSITTFAYNPV